MEYVGYVWRSSALFDDFENLFGEVMTEVEEVLIRSVGGGAGVGAQVVSTSGGGASVHMEVASPALAWVRVWGWVSGWADAPRVALADDL